MKRFLAIVNSRIKESRRKVLIDQLRFAGIDFAETQCPGHAVELARNAHEYDGLLAVGGDGTLHEVINGMDQQRQCAGIILAGTVNGIARYAGFVRLANLKNELAAGIIKPVDIIDAEFADTAGVSHSRMFAGFIATGHMASNFRISRAFRPLPFGIRVILATTLNTLIQRSVPSSISIDEIMIDKKAITSLTINNCIGNVFSSVKSWNMQDGALEVQAARRLMPGQIVSNFSLAFKFLPDPASWVTGVKKVDASFTRPVDMIGDGELFTGITRLKASVVSGRLQMIVPQDALFSYGITDS